MRKQVTAVEPNGQNPIDSAPAGSGAGPQAEHPAAKFIYPGGSRPLEGYTIKRGIGHGGFGEIYYAISDAGKEVALKLIRRNLEVELRGIRQCLNLKHPNLLDLYDIRQDGQGDTWVVMEYVSGASLEDAVANHPHGMPAEQTLAWFHGIAAGVAYLHDRGIVHRDLKPGNIFSDQRLVKVGDYGLSKFIACSRRSGQTESVGTVHYMAPEVANGRYGKEIDVYALGIILYEMLTGRVPFEGESVGEVLMKHLTARPDVSPLAEPYRGVVARALEKDPAKRYQSVGEMLAALPQPAQPPPGAARLPSAACGVAAGGVGAGGWEAFAETVVPIKAVDEEPILRSVRQSWNRLRTAWQEANLATPVKVLLLLAGLFLLLASAGVLVPLAVVVLVLYGIYRLVRMIVLARHPSSGQTGPPVVPPPAPQGTDPAASGARYGPAHARTRPGNRRRRDWHRQPPPAMLVKSPRQRLTELVGSLLLGAVVAVAMCVVTVLLYSFRVAPSDPGLYEHYARYGWLVLVSIAGTWAVLIPSKFWEGSRGEVMLRRFIMMIIGLALGALAFGAASLLMADLPHDHTFPKLSEDWVSCSLHVDEGWSPIRYHLATFGTLFLLIRWWRQADPLRATRLSLWSMFVSVVLASLITSVIKYPQPWLVMVACTISVSVQLASPWVHPRDRPRP